jgi:hypothetical protein
MIARALAADPQVLLLNDPTRGIDIGAKRDIYALLRELAAPIGAPTPHSPEDHAPSPDTPSPHSPEGHTCARTAHPRTAGNPSPGVAIVMLSTEVDEHLELMDRVLVFRDGRPAAELGRDQLSRASIVREFFGPAAAAQPATAQPAPTPNPQAQPPASAAPPASLAPLTPPSSPALINSPGPPTSLSPPTTPFPPAQGWRAGDRAWLLPAVTGSDRTGYS